MSEQSSHHESLTAGGVLIAAVLAIGIGKWLFFSNTITSYWIYTKSGAPLDRAVYSVDRSSGTVTHIDRWSDGPSLLINGPYKSCAVVDSKNWSCRDGGIEALDGDIKGHILDADTRVRKVSAFRWWFARLTHWSKAEEETNPAH